MSTLLCFVPPGPAPLTRDDDRLGRRVLIDALAARYGGTAYATIELARELAASPSISIVTVVARLDSIVAQALENAPGVRCIVLRAAPRMELARRLAWEALRLPAIVAREQFEWLISMSGMLPRDPGCELVCLLFNPVMYERRTPANRLRRAAVRRTTTWAKLVAAPSTATAELVAASVGRPCTVIPLGVDRRVFRPAAQPGDELLYVADFYAHKRHDLVLEAWRLLPAPRPTLRLVGNAAVDRAAYARVLDRIDALSDPTSVVIEHNVSLDRLVTAYQRARVFVLASEYESFSMPLAESMSCGIPSVVRDLSSLRETGGAAATYVNDESPRIWADHIQRLIGDQAEHRRARDLALREAARFTWKGFADAVTADVWA